MQAGLAQLQVCVATELFIFHGAWCDDKNFMSAAAQRGDHFFDMDILTIFGTGSVMVKNLHGVVLTSLSTLSEESPE